MSEKEEKNTEKNSIDASELKNETIKTAKEIKDSMKETNIKQETIKTKGLVTELLKNPLDKIREVATDSSNKYLKTAIILIIVWTVLVLISSTFSTIYYWGFARVFRNILSVLKQILAPICGIIVYSVIVMIMNKNNKKPLTTVISTITIAQLPLILASFVSLLNIFSSNISIITTPFTKLCSVVAIILGYFGLKSLFGEEKSKDFFKKYVVLQSIYYVVYILVGLLGIYI